ncbi:MAG: hypothetical protein IT371_30305 [Deltaproteobacteria bacterium]|nr:hypothetical protein [Deltaproteobacteria bacterium]
MIRETCAMCKRPIGDPPVLDFVLGLAVLTAGLAFPVVVARLVAALFRVLP